MEKERPIVVITLDVERNWHGFHKDTYKSLPYENPASYTMIGRSIPVLLDAAEKFDVYYTLFITGEVAVANKRMLSGLSILGHEVGVHTHPYAHPSIFKGMDPNDGFFDQLPMYSLQEQLEMIKKDKEMIQKHLGVNPTSFRAGRNAFDARTIHALQRLSFQVDSSPPFGRAIFKSSLPSFLAKIPINYDPPVIFPSDVIAPSTHLVEVLGNIGEGQLLSLKSFKVASNSQLKRRPRGELSKVLVIGFHPMIFGDEHLPTDTYLREFKKILRYIDQMGWEVKRIGELTRLKAELGSKDRLALKTLIGINQLFFSARVLLHS